jgi:hypothetical protein
MEFAPDYHEHEEFQPAMLMLAHFVIQWNWAEHNFNVLLWALSGDFYTGAAYTAGLGNQSRADLMLATARRKEADPEILGLIEFCVKAFGRIKDNRNSLVHAHSISFGEEEHEKPRWTRASSNPRALHVYCLADKSDIIENLEGACRLAILLGEVSAYYLSTFDPPPRPSFGIFPLPPPLTPTPILPHTLEDLPQSSEESARQVKRDRKAAQRSDPKNRKKGS